MRLNVFQKIGLFGLGVIVAGGIFGMVLPQILGTQTSLGLTWVFFLAGGPFVAVGIIGNFILVIYRAGAESERRRLGIVPPPSR